MCLRGAGRGELCPVPSPPSAHAVASARAARPPARPSSSGGERIFQSLRGSIRSAIARWRTGRPQCRGTARSDPRHRGAAGVRGAALRGPCCRPARRPNLGRRLAARRLALSSARRLAGPLGRRRGRREGGSAARPVLCSPRRPRCPLTCSDRLGSAAACGAKAARAAFSEVPYPRSFICSFCTTGDVFRYFSGRIFASSGNNRPRVWQFLKTRCSREC